MTFHKTACTECYHFLPSHISGVLSQSVNLTTELHLTLRSKMQRALILCPMYAFKMWHLSTQATSYPLSAIFYLHLTAVITLQDLCQKEVFTLP